MTKMHVQHMAMVSKALGEKGFDVTVVTSEDTIKKFEITGGKLNDDRTLVAGGDIDFGGHARFARALPSQTTYAEPKIKKIEDSRYRPFDFIASPAIARMRNKQIDAVIAQEKPDAIVTSLWPSGYGPFTSEVEHMFSSARAANPKVKRYSLSNDIPYLDYDFNARSVKGPQFDLVDRTFVRGDGTLRMSNFVPLTYESENKIDYVGHFIDPLPARQQMPDCERKVLVTYGTRESNWDGYAHAGYFKSVIDSIGFTTLTAHPWELVIGRGCQDVAYEYIKRYADSVNKRFNANITVRKGVPDKQYRQDVANAAMVINQFDIFVLDDISTGVPMLVSTGNLGQLNCGANEGDDRLESLERSGAPLSTMLQNNMGEPAYMGQLINAAFSHKNAHKFSIPANAADKVAATIAAEYKAAHLPDPVLGQAQDVTKQSEPMEKNQGRG